VDADTDRGSKPIGEQDVRGQIPVHELLRRVGHPAGGEQSSAFREVPNSAFVGISSCLTDRLGPIDHGERPATLANVRIPANAR
jgi:hypothetical protein